MVIILSAIVIGGPMFLGKNGYTPMAQASSLSAYTQKVSYHGSAQNVSQALEGIAKASSSQLKFKVGDPLKSDIVLVDVSNVPLNVLLQRIAKVEFAKWTFEGNLAFLNPDSKAEEAQDNATYAARAKAFKHLMDTYGTDPAETTNSNPLIYSSGIISNESCKLLDLIGPDVITRMQPGQRIVFSTNPTTMQRPFPSGCEAYLKDLAKIQSTTGEVASPTTVNGQQVEVIPPRPKRSSAEDPIAKEELVLEKTTSPVGTTSGNIPLVSTTANLVVYDGNGKILNIVAVSVPSLDRINIIAMEGPIPKNAKTQEGAEFEPILLNGIAKEMDTAQQKASLSRQTSNVGDIDAMLPYALDPVRYDPLTIVGAYITATAKAYNLNVVASLPDILTSVPSTLNFSKGVATPHRIMTAIQNYPQVNVDSSNGFLTISPSLPTVSRGNRMDRQVLKSVTNAFHSTKSLNVAFLSKIAVALHGKLDGLTANYIGYANPVATISTALQDWHLLQFYGLLNLAQQQQLIDGGKISYTSLTGEAAKTAQYLVYGAGRKLYSDTKSVGKRVSKDAMMAVNPLEETTLNFATNYESEPTEVAPSGVPLEASVAGEYSKSNAYRVDLAKNPNPGLEKMFSKSSFAPDMVAEFVMQAEFAEKAG